MLLEVNNIRSWVGFCALVLLCLCMCQAIQIRLDRVGECVQGSKYI